MAQLGKIPTDKAPDAFRTISEVAGDLDVPQHVLRFWETRFSQIRPMKRSGGRRYYRPDDVELLRGIRHLLYGEGYTIKGVQRILREQGVRAVQALAEAASREPSASPASGHEVEDVLDEMPPETDLGDEGNEGVWTDEGEASGGRLEERREPVMARASGQPRAVPGHDAPAVRARESQTGQQRPSRLSVDQVRQLESALSELTQCRRLLDNAKQSG